VANSQEATVGAIAGCCARIEAMCAGLGEAEWHQPTALPAWDVQDVVAHLGSLEAMLLGRAEPEHEPAATAHVRNELGALNERMVDRRRSWSGAEVLDEFRETSALRIDELEELDEADLDRLVKGPTGTIPQRAFLGVRLWDYLVHEMDIAEALGVEIDLGTPAATRVLDEMLLLLPRAVARGGTPDGGVVAVAITAPLVRAVAVRMKGGRAALTDPGAAEKATLHLRASPTALLRVGAGRTRPEAAVASGDVEVDGDRDLAVRVLAAINVVP
jgi:uncharacterized protein (TIGR03083 family)